MYVREYRFPISYSPFPIKAMSIPARILKVISEKQEFLSGLFEVSRFYLLLNLHLA